LHGWLSFYHDKCPCYICLICEKLRFCQDFVPITWHENIMQVSIFLHIVFSSWLNTFNYTFWDIFVYNIARFITLAICFTYVWICFQTFIILFVEIFLNKPTIWMVYEYFMWFYNLDNMWRKFEKRKTLSPMVNH